MENKIWVYSIQRNEAQLLPFWLRHYEQFAEKILVWDDASDDGSRDILRSHPLVEMHDWQYPDGIFEDAFLKHAYEVFPKSTAQWVIWVDADEFVIPDRGTMEDILYSDIEMEAVLARGFNMMGNGIPVDDGRQIYEILKLGVFAPLYSKTIVFRPQAKISWKRGKHELNEECKIKLSSRPLVKILHYRYLGPEYTGARNARNLHRCGVDSGDHNAAWSCRPEWQGEGSVNWVHLAELEKFNVMDYKLDEETWPFRP